MGVLEIIVVGMICFNIEDGLLEIQINGGVLNYMIEIMDLEGQVMFYIVIDNIFIVNDLFLGFIMIVIIDLLGSEMIIMILIFSLVLFQVQVLDYWYVIEGNCNGQIFVSIFGGIFQYIVNWNNGSIGVSIGGFCVDQWYVLIVIDVNGCSIEVDFIFINNFDVQVGDVEFISCLDDINGVIDIDVVGGDLNYIFVWNDVNGNQVFNMEDLIGFIVGIYILIIIEVLGNMLICQVVIEIEFVLAVVIIFEENYNGFDVSCLDVVDGVLSVIVIGSSGYLYEWINVEISMLVGIG